MIEIRNEDIVAERRTADGRFVLFTSTDVKAGWPLPWWGAVCDTGGDGFGLPVRLDELAAPAGWTARQLLVVARRRFAAEGERLRHRATHEAAAALDQAAVERMERISPSPAASSNAISFRGGGVASPYPWTLASQGGFDLPLCPDPASREEGISPEMILIILDQVLLGGLAAALPIPGLRQARIWVAAALAAETRRLAAIRG